MIISLDRIRRTPPRLIDGALIQPHRADMVARMAADLVAADAFHSEREAIMSLVGKYHPISICHLIDDARQVAMTEAVVAREMSRS